jgi:hypothetical protein
MAGINPNAAYSINLYSKMKVCVSESATECPMDSRSRDLLRVMTLKEECYHRVSLTKKIDRVRHHVEMYRKRLFLNNWRRRAPSAIS